MSGASTQPIMSRTAHFHSMLRNAEFQLDVLSWFSILRSLSEQFSRPLGL